MVPILTVKNVLSPNYNDFKFTVWNHNFFVSGFKLKTNEQYNSNKLYLPIRTFNAKCSKFLNQKTPNILISNPNQTEPKLLVCGAYKSSSLHLRVNDWSGKDRESSSLETDVKESAEYIDIRGPLLGFLVSSMEELKSGLKWKLKKIFIRV